MSTTPAVGQVWADNDPRYAGRTLLVTEVIAGGLIATPFVTVETLTNTTQAQADIDGPDVHKLHADRRGKKTHIRADRLTPTRTGYRLLGDIWQNAQPIGPWSASTAHGPLDALRAGGFPDRYAAARWLLTQEA